MVVESPDNYTLVPPITTHTESPTKYKPSVVNSSVESAVFSSFYESELILPFLIRSINLFPHCIFIEDPLNTKVESFSPIVLLGFPAIVVVDFLSNI